MGTIWATDESIPIPIEKWSAVTQSEFPAAAHIDLSRTVGTRIWLVDHESRSDLVVQVHHACSDAIGKCQFIDDLLMLYARNVGELSSDVELRRTGQSASATSQSVWADVGKTAAAASAADSGTSRLSLSTLYERQLPWDSFPTIRQCSSFRRSLHRVHSILKGQ